MIGAAVVVVVAIVAAVVGAVSAARVDGVTGIIMVGTSKEASCVGGAWAVETRNSPPTMSMMRAAGLVRRSVLRTFIRKSGP